MKCYKCNGTGEYDIEHECPYCGGTGEINDIKVPPFTDGQKKLIEMTEKLANRKLICDVDDDIDETPTNLCKDCISKNVCGNPNITGCISYTKQDEKFLPINCYVCNASGRIAGNNYRHSSKCTRCNGTGEINYYTLTNEDFLRMATTEQLAEFLDGIAIDGGDAIKRSNKSLIVYKHNFWEEWLKQPHKE